MIIMEPKGKKREQIKTSEQIAKIMYAMLGQIKDEYDKDVEHFWVSHLDGSNKIVLIELVSMGVTNGAAVNPKRVFQRAVQTNKVVSIFVCHNHPSGNLKPSAEDKKITRQLFKSGEILGIMVLDHIIIGNTDNEVSEYYSFSDDGLV